MLSHLLEFANDRKTTQSKPSAASIRAKLASISSA
jgi:hypothetical protein